MTVWRSADRWFAARQALSSVEVPDPVSTGVRLSRRRREALLDAIHRAAFWERDDWPERLAPDAYTAFFEGFRAGCERRRHAWCPDKLFSESAWILLNAFDEIQPSGLLWWRRVAV